MRQILCLVFVAISLYGCAQPRMTYWDASRISAMSQPTVPLRNTKGEITTTVNRSLISELLGIFRKLERVAGLSGVQFVIADPKEPNAFATHDQPPKIGLTVGMLNLVGRDYDAYAAILGHELAHLTLSHGTIRKERDDVAKGVNSIVGNVIDAFIPFGGLMTSLAVTAVTTVYSRDEERDADSKGMEYMVAAGFDPRGAVRLWSMMSSANTGFSIPFLSTHPMSSERIENMENLATNTQKPNALKAESTMPSSSNLAASQNAGVTPKVLPPSALSRMRAAFKPMDFQCLSGIERTSNECLAGKECRASFESYVVPACKLQTMEMCYEQINYLRIKCAYSCDIAAEAVGKQCSAS